MKERKWAHLRVLLALGLLLQACGKVQSNGEQQEVTGDTGPRVGEVTAGVIGQALAAEGMKVVNILPFPGEKFGPVGDEIILGQGLGVGSGEVVMTACYGDVCHAYNIGSGVSQIEAGVVTLAMPEQGLDARMGDELRIVWKSGVDVQQPEKVEVVDNGRVVVDELGKGPAQQGGGWRDFLRQAGLLVGVAEAAVEETATATKAPEPPTRAEVPTLIVTPTEAVEIRRKENKVELVRMVRDWEAFVQIDEGQLRRYVERYGWRVKDPHISNEPMWPPILHFPEGSNNWVVAFSGGSAPLGIVTEQDANFGREEPYRAVAAQGVLLGVYSLRDLSSPHLTDKLVLVGSNVDGERIPLLLHLVTEVEDQEGEKLFSWPLAWQERNLSADLPRVYTPFSGGVDTDYAGSLEAISRAIDRIMVFQFSAGPGSFLKAVKNPPYFRDEMRQAIFPEGDRKYLELREELAAKYAEYHIGAIDIQVKPEQVHTMVLSNIVGEEVFGYLRDRHFRMYCEGKVTLATRGVPLGLVCGQLATERPASLDLGSLAEDGEIVRYEVPALDILYFARGDEPLGGLR